LFGPAACVFFHPIEVGDSWSTVQFLPDAGVPTAVGRCSLSGLSAASLACSVVEYTVDQVPDDRRNDTAPGKSSYETPRTVPEVLLCPLLEARLGAVVVKFGLLLLSVPTESCLWSSKSLLAPSHSMAGRLEGHVEPGIEDNSGAVSSLALPDCPLADDARVPPVVVIDFLLHFVIMWLILHCPFVMLFLVSQDQANRPGAEAGGW
jgi:hypothetical protein